MAIELDSEVPIYQQIRDRVIEAIADGALTEGDPLPSTRQLAGDLGINFHTVNKAYDQLRQQGVIRINRKSGAVVRRDARSGPPDPTFLPHWQEQLRTMLAEAVVQGVDEAVVRALCASVLESFASPIGKDQG